MVFAWIQSLSKSRFFRYGVPFLSMLVAGSFGLQHFAQLRYSYRRREIITQEQAEALGVKMKPKEERPSLETEYQKLIESDLDMWQNIRGPRPWENSKDVQEKLRGEGEQKNVQNVAPT